jgi:hypothetical protein
MDGGIRSPYVTNSTAGKDGNGRIQWKAGHVMTGQRSFDVLRPVCYEIVVRGELSGRLASAFDEMEVHVAHGVTRIVGVVRDQAQLHGMLEQIRRLGIELVSVTPVDGGTALEAPAEGSHDARGSDAD